MAIQTRSKLTQRAAINSIACLIAELGYSRTRVSDIVATAGLTKGALYFHFPSKDATAEALLAVAAERYEFVDSHEHENADCSHPRAAALALLAEYTDRATADVVLQAEAVLWSDPEFAVRARAGVGFSRLQSRLAELTSPQLADALMAVIVGVTATPGQSNGLATDAGRAQLIELSSAVLTGLRQDSARLEPHTRSTHTEEEEN